MQIVTPTWKLSCSSSASPRRSCPSSSPPAPCCAGPPQAVERVEADLHITLGARTTVVAVDGDETLRAVHLNGPDGKIVLPCAGLFSFIGADPSSGWLNGCAALDDRGFVLTDLSLTPDQLGQTWLTLARTPLPFETSHPGLFAVGDLRSGSTKRVAAAVGEGSASVRSVHQYLAF